MKYNTADRRASYLVCGDAIPSHFTIVRSGIHLPVVSRERGHGLLHLRAVKCAGRPPSEKVESVEVFVCLTSFKVDYVCRLDRTGHRDPSVSVAGRLNMAKHILKCCRRDRQSLLRGCSFLPTAHARFGNFHVGISEFLNLAICGGCGFSKQVLADLGKVFQPRS